MNFAEFELEQSAEQPVPSVELPELSKDLPDGGKSMEEIIRNLENLDKNPETGAKSMSEVIANLERMRLQESGRESVQETSAGGIIREAISKLTDAIFHPEGKEQAAMRDIDSAAREWHLQEDPYTCAVACQEFIIHEFTGINVSEEMLHSLAEAQDWFIEGSGTPPDDIGKLLDIYGIENDINYEASFQDLRDALSEGSRAIVAVNNIAMSTEWCDGYPFASCNHAIEVIGIDESNPEDIRVIINDPGVEDGCAKSVSYDNFMDAWKNTSGGYMMTAYRN